MILPPRCARCHDSDTAVSLPLPVLYQNHITQTCKKSPPAKTIGTRTQDKNTHTTRRHTQHPKEKHTLTKTRSLTSYTHNAPGTCPSRPPIASAAPRGPPRRTAETRTVRRRRRRRQGKARQRHSRSPRPLEVEATGDRFRTALGGEGKPAAPRPARFRVRRRRVRRPVCVCSSGEASA